MERKPHAQRGFTLVELLVALLILAVLSGLGWRSVDVLLSSERVNREASTRWLTLQAALTQWGYDLDAATVNLLRPPVQFQTERIVIVRRLSGSDALSVVVWWRGERDVDGQPQTHWLRWQSAPSRTRGELENALAAAQSTALAADARTVPVLPAQQVKVRFYRNGVWLDAKDDRLATGSAIGAASPSLPGDPTSRALALANTTAGQFHVPDGVQLELQLPGLPAPLRKDWASAQVVPQPNR
jgi:general secretion pathway protein J